MKSQKTSSNCWFRLTNSTISLTIGAEKQQTLTFNKLQPKHVQHFFAR